MKIKFDQRTRLAVDLIRAIVLTVVKEVTTQGGANAPAIGTQELVFLTWSWGGLCGEKHVKVINDHNYIYFTHI